MKISVVIPCYKCEASLEQLYIRLKSTFIGMDSDYEIIMVNDASPENDWEEIKKITETDKKVIGINLSRNFGQHYAITAGLENVTGEYVVVMDGDLQDQPEEIPKLYKKIGDGYDVVFGRRYQRKDGFFKKMSSNIFRIIYEYLTETKLDNSISNFTLCKKKVIDNLKRIKEHGRNYGLAVLWLGFNVGYVDIEHAQRYSGKSSYTLKKLIKHGIESVVSHSNKPLRLSIEFGFFISMLSLFYALYLILRFFLIGLIIEGWTSVMVSMWFIGGLLLANMGVIGLYIGKVFDEVKDRPLYIVKEILNGGEKSE